MHCHPNEQHRKMKESLLFNRTTEKLVYTYLISSGKLLLFSNESSIQELKVVQSLLISPSFPVFTPTLPSFLMAVTNASLKSAALFANRTTVGCDAASENSTWSELSSPFPDTRSW